MFIYQTKYPLKFSAYGKILSKWSSKDLKDLQTLFQFSKFFLNQLFFLCCLCASLFLFSLLLPTYKNQMSRSIYHLTQFFNSYLCILVAISSDYGIHLNLGNTVEVYLGSCQTNTMEMFCESRWWLKIVFFFRKEAPS